MIIKYPGSKTMIASWIVSNFPEDYQNMTYLEPYFGSGSIFLAKAPSKIETINDMNGEITNLFKQIRDNCDELIFKLQYTPWSRDEFNMSYKTAADDLERARRFIVKCWFSIGAYQLYRNGMRVNIKSYSGNLEGFYKSLPKEITGICDRLKPKSGNYVQIENTDAITLIKKYNRPNVLMYLDPPYTIDSRRRKKIYTYDYTDEDHEILLRLINESKAKIIISGYESELYNSRLKKWNMDKIITFDTVSNKRTECIWMNYKPNTNYLFDLYEYTRGGAEKVYG
jgi:DNA adenine methylase